jgi:hypothetical protein
VGVEQPKQLMRAEILDTPCVKNRTVKIIVLLLAIGVVGATFQTFRRGTSQVLFKFPPGHVLAVMRTLEPA